MKIITGIGISFPSSSGVPEHLHHVSEGLSVVYSREARHVIVFDKATVRETNNPFACRSFGTDYPNNIGLLPDSPLPAFLDQCIREGNPPGAIPPRAEIFVLVITDD